MITQTQTQESVINHIKLINTRMDQALPGKVNRLIIRYNLLYDKLVSKRDYEQFVTPRKVYYYCANCLNRIFLSTWGQHGTFCNMSYNDRYINDSTDYMIDTSKMSYLEFEEIIR